MQCLALHNEQLPPVRLEQMKSTTLVLTTVNAPYSEQLDAPTFTYCLIDQNAAKSKPGHMSSFFGEVDPALQVGFAEQTLTDHWTLGGGTAMMLQIDHRESHDVDVSLA
jgi:hypothetical protein